MTNTAAHHATIIEAHPDEVEVLSREHQWRLLEEFAAGEAAARALEEGRPSSEHCRVLQAQVRIGRRARERLISSNIRLVTAIARGFVRRSPWLTLDDLVQEGVTGLNRAIEKFDRSLGTAFSTYASWWIRQSVSRAVGNSGLIRVPIHAQDARALWNDARLVAFRRFDSVECLLERESWPCTDESDDGPARRTSPPHRLITEEEGFERVDFDLLLQEVLLSLPARQADIIRRRFGLSGESETLEEIGQSYGVTRERIRQLEVQAIEQLRRAFGVSLPEEPPSSLQAAA